jgi:hypothetical protein
MRLWTDHGDAISETAWRVAGVEGRVGRMPKSDRAFRALARAQPDVIAGLLAAVAPGLLPVGASLVPDDVAPTHLDGLPPELDADFATRVAEGELAHVECQGYRDTGFEARTLWYHVGFALRNRGRRRVRTVALWLTSPPEAHPRDEMTVDDITVKVTTVVLQKVKASVLLADPRTACFAAGAHREGRSTDELCAAVALALRERNASWAERHMAVVAAAMRGRYKSMVRAMEHANLEPVVIEDLVRLGEDLGRKRGMKKGMKQGLKKGLEQGLEQGLEKGLEQGLEQGREQGLEQGREQGLEQGREQGLEKGRLAEERGTLRRVLALRKLPLGPEQEQQIDACSDLAKLRRWHDQAIFAESAADALR